MSPEDAGIRAGCSGFARVDAVKWGDHQNSGGPGANDPGATMHKALEGSPMQLKYIVPDGPRVVTPQDCTTVHCFFGCGHTAHGEPRDAHDAMEAHYASEHQIGLAAYVKGGKA